MTHHRTIWISDFHLGTRGSRVEHLLDFLTRHESKYLYLVGDIIDGWAWKRSWFWDSSHNEVMRLLLSKAQNGTRVTYIPGNHDEFARDFVGTSFGGIAIRRRALHELADGRRALVLHGDEFDGIIACAKWISRLGAVAYELVLRLNSTFNRFRGALGLPYWSLAAFLKEKSKTAVQFVADFENAVALEARQKGVDVVVCGHIHKAEMRRIGNIVYANTGDWVESCTALVEQTDGRLQVLYCGGARSAQAESRSLLRPMKLVTELVASEPVLAPVGSS